MNPTRINIDTSKFAIDPKKKNYPKELQKIKLFLRFNNKRKLELMTYITLMYDKTSSIRRDMTIPYVQKKRDCLDMCSLILGGNKIPADIVDMLSGKNEIFCDLVAYYISLQHARELFLLAAYEFAINMSFQKLSTELDNAALKTVESMTQKCMDLEKKLFGGDEYMGFKEALSKSTDIYKNDFRIESVVNIIEEKGELPKSWDPIPGGYKPEDLHFAGDGSY